jgi:copper homeostasis protein (lipoprotein)
MQTPPVPAPLLADLPATFLGTLPCADCEGVRYHLNLFDDDSFLLRTTRLGKTGGTTDDLGSWTLSSDRRLIVLQGRNDAMQLFEIVAPGTIRKLEADGRPNTSRGSSQLTRSSQFRPTDVRATMRGAYTYLADAATFVECSTGQRWTVAAENVSRELEAAYLKVRPAPGASVVVDVDGLLVQRPRADGGMQSALVVERVRGLLPKQSCPARFSGVPLTDTHWRLTHLGDRAVPAATDPRREPSLTLLEGTNSFAGSSGCNRLVGSYAISGSTMTLTSGGTMVACKEEAKTESAFLTALQATRTYRITGRVLELTDAKGVRVARFEARLPTGITVR